MPHRYADRATLKARLRIPAADTRYDATLDDVAGGVSRLINEHCKRRWFYPRPETRYFTALEGYCLKLPRADLLSIVSIATDDDGDGVYENAWASTDWFLGPLNNDQGDLPRPFWQIHVTKNGSYTFPAGVARGVKVVANWGHYDQRETASATAAEAIDASETVIDVTDASVFSPGMTVLIDSEQMFVTAATVNTAPTEDTITVQRAQNGTTAATHLTGAAIDVFVYPIVSEACLWQCERSYRAIDTPMGVAGGGEFAVPMQGADFGNKVAAIGLHPFVRTMLSPFRRRLI